MTHLVILRAGLLLGLGMMLALAASASAPPVTQPAPAPSPTADPGPLFEEPTVPAPPDDVEFRAPDGFPDAASTGVPPGTALTVYDGPCTVTESVTLDAVDATGCEEFRVQAKGVVIRSSLLPRVETVDGGSVHVKDSTVLAGAWSDGAVWGSNLSVVRSDVRGGQHSVHCENNCHVRDSWLHDQHNPDGESYHNNAFISNGGSGVVLRHNTLHCTALLNATDGGCTADVSFFGDFAPVEDVLVENNLLMANDSSISYCAYGGEGPSKPFPRARGVRFIDNVFQRGDNGLCGRYGPSTGFAPDGPGNEWTGNVWDDGSVVPPI